jgi:predicted nucleotidyltransferase
MAKKEVITPQIKNMAVRFARTIKDKGIPVAKLIIFGSYAKGKAKGYSDIDLAIVSPKFGEDPVLELQFLLKLSRSVDDRIEPIPVSLEEYRAGTSPLVFEVKKFGKEILFH